MVVSLIQDDFFEILMCATLRLPGNGSLEMQSLKATKCFLASIFFLNLQVSRHQSCLVI